MYIKIPFVYLHAMASDLLEGKVKLSFTFSLNDETMKLREQIAMLKVLDQMVELEIRSPQTALPGMGHGTRASENNIAASGEDAAPGSFKDEFAKAATTLISRATGIPVAEFAHELNQDESEPRPRKRKKGDDTLVTFSATGHAPVTITAKQLKDAANADPANLVRKSKIERMKITRRKK